MKIRMPAIGLVMITATVVSAADQGPAVLTNGGVWRSHITLMPPVARMDNGLVKVRVYQGIDEESALPPGDWTKPEFDDSSWGYWREPHPEETLKLKKKGKKQIWSSDGEDTGVRLYEPGQYGMGRSISIGLHCLRGRFKVNDAAGVDSLRLSVAFRGGLVAYLNGTEIGRSHLPGEGAIEPRAVAEDYPNEVFFDAKEEVRKLGKEFTAMAGIPLEAGFVERLNGRIRRLDIDVPVDKLVDGVNVLALEFHRSPATPRGEKSAGKDAWSTCGPAGISLRGTGAIAPERDRPEGLRVWNVSSMRRITRFGYVYGARSGAAGAVRYPLSWGETYGPIVPARLVAARNGVSHAQLGISCDRAIKGLRAGVSDLTAKEGEGRIGGSALEVRYVQIPDAPCSRRDSRAVSFIDAMYEKPPAEIAAREAGETHFWAASTEKQGLTTWMDAGAAASVWIGVKVPADAAPGEYRGEVTVSADGHEPVKVPVRLDVADWIVPDPREWIPVLSNPHSPDALALWYNVPLWSEEHWKLVETTLARMGEIGSSAVFLPVIAKSWLLNEQSMLYWVKQPDGTFTHDYRIIDRYLDLVGKYMKPDVYCIQAADFYRSAAKKAQFTVFDPDAGTATFTEGPACEPTPEAIAFWKPVIDGMVERLKKRGARENQITLGMCWEEGASQRGGDEKKVDMFRKVMPKWMRLAHVAHYGGAPGRGPGDIDFGFVMSIFGNETGIKTKTFGARNLPLTLVKHYRIDARIDLRPTAHRAGLRQCVELALQDTQGMGPVGMDIWYMPGDPDTKRREGFMERTPRASLSMKGYSTTALLAPGPDGPISTARFEMLREGMQEAEARMRIELALADEAARGKMGEALVKRCEKLVEERTRVLRFLNSGGFPHAEPWKWYENAGVEDRTLDLFDCAGKVAAALGE